MESGYDDSFEALRQITGISEYIPDNEDKLIAKALDAKGYLNQLNQEGVPRDEIRVFAEGIVDELDAGCTYRNKLVTITGTIYRPQQMPEEEGGITWAFVRDTVDALPVVSHGFVARYDDEAGYSVGHMFALAGDREEVVYGNVRQINIPQGYAEVGEVAINYTHDALEAATNLQNFAETLINDIDEAIFNSSSIVATFHRLAEVKPGELYQDMQRDILMDAATYVEELLIFDSVVPYEIEITGSYLKEQSDEEYIICVPDVSKPNGGCKRVLAYIKSVQFTDDREISEGRCLVTEGPHFSLCLNIVHDERVGGETNDEIVVLMKDITACESLRNLLRSSD